MKFAWRKIGYGLIATMLGCYLFVQTTGPRGVRSLITKWQQIDTMQKENAELAAENRRRSQRIERLQKDQEAQELEIRKRLKLQRKGSVDFYLPESDEAQPEEPSSSVTTP